MGNVGQSDEMQYHRLRIDPIQVVTQRYLFLEGSSVMCQQHAEDWSGNNYFTKTLLYINIYIFFAMLHTTSCNPVSGQGDFFFSCLQI